MRRPVWSFPSLLMSLYPLPPFVFASFSRFRRFRGRRRPGRGLLGRMRRHWILSPRLPGGWVGLAHPGRRIAPASAASLSYSARPPSPPTPHCARGGVAPLVVVHDGPAAAATGLPPVSSYAPTPLAEAGSVRLSPPPTVDSRPHPGPSGLGAFRFAGRHAIASRHLPSLGLLPRVIQPPTGRSRVPQGPCGSER